MNSNGGILLVGIKNDRSVSGIEADYKLFSDADGWIQYLNSLIINHINIGALNYIQVRIRWIKSLMIHLLTTTLSG